jgi:hypothetical protein
VLVFVCKRFGQGTELVDFCSQEEKFLVGHAKLQDGARKTAAQR